MSGMRMSKFLFCLMAIAVLAALRPMPVAAQGADDPFRKKVFLMVITKGRFDVALSTARFCTVVQGGQIECGKNRRDKRNLIFNSGLGNLTLMDHSATQTDMGWTLFSRDLALQARYAMKSVTFGQGGSYMNEFTYHFDARPGTIYVLYSKGLSKSAALANAKEILSADERFGHRLGVLPFEPVQAARVQCDAGTDVCRLGEEIDPRKLSMTYRLR